jgi:hypothetical protein
MEWCERSAGTSDRSGCSEARDDEWTGILAAADRLRGDRKCTGAQSREVNLL